MTPILLDRLCDALETAAGQYGPVTDEQRNEWLMLVQEARHGWGQPHDRIRDEGVEGGVDGGA